MIAEKFEKEHKNVLRDIQNLTASLDQDFTKLNFELSAYKDSTGRTLPMYNLTRDGFSLLVMGFTGEKALQWKVAFINAFNAMEAQLRNSMPNFNDPVEAAEAWLKEAKAKRAAEEKARLEAEAHAKTQRALTQKTDALGEILNEWGEGETFRSCIAQAKIFSQWYNIRYITDAGDKFYGSLGRLMTCLCNGGLTSTGKPATKDPRFIGHKFEWKYESHPAAAFGGWNIYHVDAWQYLIDIVKQDGASTIPFIGKFAL